jgi:uncharacterized protein YukE
MDMTILHMETDSVRAVAGQLKQAVDMIQNQLQVLNGSVQSVDWMGPSREEFVSEVEGLIRQIDGQAEAGIVLAQRVENEVSEWEQRSQSLAGGSNGQAGMVSNLSSFLNGGGGGGAGGRNGGGGDGGWGPLKDGPADTEYSLLLGRESRSYSGYLKGDLTFDEAKQFIEKDPFKKEYVKGSAILWEYGRSRNTAVWDGHRATSLGNFGGSLGSVEESVKGSLVYKEGALQASGEWSKGFYAAKGTYDASVAGVGIAAVAFAGAEYNLQGNAVWDPKKGEVGAKAQFDEFVGAKAEGTATAEVGAVKAKATGGVSYGLGATAKGDIGFSEGHARAEFELGATLGLGVEGGISVDLDVNKAAKTITELGTDAVDWLF